MKDHWLNSAAAYLKEFPFVIESVTVDGTINVNRPEHILWRVVYSREGRIMALRILIWIPTNEIFSTDTPHHRPLSMPMDRMNMEERWVYIQHWQIDRISRYRRIGREFDPFVRDP